MIERLGTSLLNIEMKEIAYLSVMGIELECEWAAHRSNNIHLKIQNLQVDNQMSQSMEEDAIILSKKQPQKQDWKPDALSRNKLLQLKCQTEAIENIDNFHSFTHFYLNLAPLELRVDGIFLQEIIKYIAQIQTKVKAINLREEYAQALAKLRRGSNAQANKRRAEVASSQQTVLFFHHFVISPIKVDFSISFESFLFSDSSFFNNSGLRLAIILFSSLKNTSLVFQSFRRSQHQATLSTFFSELKHYFIQIYFNKKHLLKIISKVFLESLREFSSSCWSTMKSTFTPARTMR